MHLTIKSLRTKILFNSYNAARTLGELSSNLSSSTVVSLNLKSYMNITVKINSNCIVNGFKDAVIQDS